MTAAPASTAAVAMGVTPLAWLAAVCGIAVAAGVTVAATAVLAPHDDDPGAGGGGAGRAAADVLRRVVGAARHPDHPDAGRDRGGVAWLAAGVGCGRQRGGRSPGWRWRWSGSGRRG